MNNNCVGTLYFQFNDKSTICIERDIKCTYLYFSTNQNIHKIIIVYFTETVVILKSCVHVDHGISFLSPFIDWFATSILSLKFVLLRRHLQPNVKPAHSYGCINTSTYTLCQLKDSAAFDNSRCYLQHYQLVIVYFVIMINICLDKNISYLQSVPSITTARVP